MSRLTTSFRIHKLAHDLGLRSTEDPISSIIQFCEKRVRSFLKEFPKCSSPSELLDILAAKLRTKFEIIRDDQDLNEIKRRYIAAGERAFANLENEFPVDVFGVTFRRLTKKPWEPDFVSVIDSRGEKSFRANHTKWHELGHLLVMTDQSRLAFRRTFCKQDFKDPEESLVDVLAGHFEYWPLFFTNRMTGRVSFRKIEDVRVEICPEASKASSIFGLVKAWPTPCVLIEASLDYKQKDKDLQGQAAMPFRDIPKKDLRVTSMLANDPARLLGMRLHRNWRVPRESALYRAFEGSEPTTEIENLNWWTTSTGSRLPDFQVSVETRKAGDVLQALITPEKL
jgi:hypothetical protein